MKGPSASCTDALGLAATLAQFVLRPRAEFARMNVSINLTRGDED
jgi:hypothetical protein